MKKLIFIALCGLSVFISSSVWAFPPCGVCCGDVSVTTINASETPGDHAAAPTLAFGDGNTGLYEASDNALYVSIAGGNTMRFLSTGMSTAYGDSGPLVRAQTSTTTNAVLCPHSNYTATGLGGAAGIPQITVVGVPAQVWGTVVTLTAAQVNALRATPITIVAAKGVNTVIELVSAVITYDYATAAFTVGADEDLVIEYADGTDATASIETTGFLDQADDEVRFYPNVLAAGADIEPCINQGLQIFNTGTGEIADGGGEVDIRVTFRVYPTGF